MYRLIDIHVYVHVGENRRKLTALTANINNWPIFHFQVFPLDRKIVPGIVIRKLAANAEFRESKQVFRLGWAQDFKDFTNKNS